MQVICIYVKQIIRGEAGGNKLKCNWRQKYVIRTIDVRNSDKDEARSPRWKNERSYLSAIDGANGVKFI